MSVAEASATKDSATTSSVESSSAEGSRDVVARPPTRVWGRLFRSELALIGGRRRNQVGLVVLAAMPIIMAIATKMTTSDRRRGGDLMGSMTTNGLFVPLAALLVELTMFLPLAIAMLSGDAIAGEANTGTLRYLLTVPVSRTRLLLVKYASLCFGALWGVLTVAIPGAAIGIALFGFGDLPTLSGTTLSGGAAIGRFALVILYVTACLAALAAVGLFISTLTEQPIAAAIAVMIFTIVSWILDGVPQLDWLHDWLLVDRWMAFQDFLRDPIAWHDIPRGLLVNGVYAVVFWLAAWARFAGKDVTS